MGSWAEKGFGCGTKSTKAANTLENKPVDNGTLYWLHKPEGYVVERIT